MAEVVVPDLQGMVISQALNYGINPALALSLAHQESSMNPSSVSPTGVSGLFQVNADNWSRYAQPGEERTDPNASTRVGLGKFRRLLDVNRGDVAVALRQYNGTGPGSDPNFVQNVLAHYPKYAQYEGLTRLPPQGRQQTVQAAQARPSLDELDRQATQPQTSPVATPGASPGQGRLSLDELDAQAMQPQQANQPEGSVTARIEPSWWNPSPDIPPEQVRRTVVPEIGLGELKRTSEGGFERIVPGQGEPTLGQSLARAGEGVLQLGLPVAGGMLAGTGGVIAGGLAANLIGRTTGLTPPEKPLFNVGPLQVNLSDLAAVVAPLAFKGADVGIQRYMRQSPAAQAVTTAEQATQAAQQQWQKEVSAMQAAQAKGDQAAYDAALKRAKVLQADYAKQVKAYQTTQQAAEDQATKATAANEAAYQKQAQQYGNAWEEQQAFDRAQTAQHDAAQRLEGVPEQFAPQMPPRTVSDVRLDMDRLDMGGEHADAVIKRLGVSTKQQAAYALSEEGDRLAQATGSMGVKAQPAGPPPTIARQPQPPEPGASELQQTIKELGGISLAKRSDITRDLYDVISKREGGKETARLLNNNGLSPEQMAEELMQRGYDVHDTGSLLDAVRASVEEGRPMYPRTANLEAPAFQETPRAAQVSVGGTGNVSRQLYQRFNDIYGGASVDTSPVQEALAGMRAKLEHTSSDFQKLAKQIEAQGPSVTGKEAHDTMKLLNQHADDARQVNRESALQLHRAYQESMHASIPEGREMLGQANTAWKGERAVKELQRAIDKRGRGAMLRIDPQTGETIVDVGKVVNELATGRVTDFLSPEQLTRLQGIARSFVGTPQMPRGGRPVLPSLPESPVVVTAPPAGPPPAPPPGVQVPPSPPLQLPPQPGPVQPTLERPPFHTLRFLSEFGGSLGLEQIPLVGPYLRAVGVGGTVLREVTPQVSYGLSKLLLSERGLPILMNALGRTGGRLTPEILGLLSGAAGTLREDRRSGTPRRDSAGAPVGR